MTSLHSVSDSKVKKSLVKLMAVGDIMLGEHPICIGHGVGSIIEKKGPEFLFDEVSEFLKKGDLVFGNLESVLSDIEIDHNKLQSVQLRASENSVNGLKFAGFNLLSLANNHILEHGESSLKKTKDVLSKNRICALGVSESKEISRIPFTLELEGISFGFLSYCLINDNTAYCSVNNSFDIVTDIKKVKDDVDILIVSLHWGNEFVRKPSSYQVQLAHAIIDSGAKLILGHHPHVLQGVEKYKNGVIVYSLGNFVFDMWQKKMRESMIFSCEFLKNGISNFEIIPVMIGNDFQPYLLDGDRKKKLQLQITENFLKTIDENSYQYEVNLCRNLYRLDLVIHLTMNFYKYKPLYLFQLVKEFIGKRC